MAPPTKKRKITVTAVEKIDFDPSARAEYLTGFHKRKVARQKFAQDEAAKKDKEEKLRLRKEVRYICTHVTQAVTNPILWGAMQHQLTRGPS
jgi:hypothetical protein